MRWSQGCKRIRLLCYIRLVKKNTLPLIILDEISELYDVTSSIIGLISSIFYSSVLRCNDACWDYTESTSAQILLICSEMIPEGVLFYMTTRIDIESSRFYALLYSTNSTSQLNSAIFQIRSLYSNTSSKLVW